jgi:hypothetical protein
MENSSILVPKIDVVETAPINHASVHLEEEKTTIPVELQKTKKTWPKVMLSIAVFLLVFLVYNVISGLIIYQKTQKLINNAKVLAESTKSQDIVKIKTDLANTKKSLNATALSFKMVAWEKFLPFVGVYISDVSRTIKAGQAGLDAGESVLTVIEPYSDLLGFKNGESSNVLVAVTGEQTAQDRIDFIVKTIPDLIPQIDVISGKVKIILIVTPKISKV